MDDNLKIKGESILLNFNTKEDKDNFISTLENMVSTNEIINLVNYTCGDCKEYPCFRNYSKDYKAGLCFEI